MRPETWSRPVALTGWLLEFIACVLLFCMMALTVVDTFMRKVLSQPIASAFELTELTLTLIIFAGLPLITARRGHVQVELLERLLSSSVRRGSDLVVDLITTIVLTVLAWQLWIKAVEQTGYGDTTSVLQIALAPITYAMSVLAGAAAVTSLVNMVLAAAGRSAADAARMGGRS